jgi:Microsomal signal peptidase 25 kDa subunit (SPC25)
VLIAGVTFYLDRQLGWEATEALWVKIAVGVYFALNTFLTYWIWGVEAGEVFKGARKTGETVPSTLCFGQRFLSNWLYRLLSNHSPKRTVQCIS